MRKFEAFLFVSMLLLVSAAPAPGDPGDIAIYREATAGDTVGTSAYTHTYDTVVREVADIYSLTAGSDITLGEAGHYMALYTAQAVDADLSAGNNQRAELQSWLNVGGINLPIGHSQTFVRRRYGEFTGIMSGGGIFQASQDDVLQLQTVRSDTETSGGTMAMSADANGIQLLKLRDTWDYARLSLTNTATNAITADGWVDVAYDTQDELDTGTFGHTEGTAGITLATPGHYLIFANTYGARPSNNTRTGMMQRLTLGDGVTQTQVAGSQTTVYLRGAADGSGALDGATAIGMIIETTAADQVLQVQVARTAGQNISLIGGKTAISIAKLPDTADYIRLNDSGTDSMDPSSPTAMGWDINDTAGGMELDPGGFTHDRDAIVSPDSQIFAARDDDYLFLSALYDDNDATFAGTTRAKYMQQWRIDGTEILPYASAGRYSRDDTVDEVGNWSGALVEMTAGQYVEVLTQSIANQANVLNAVDKGFQGVRISSMFPPITELVWDEAGNGTWAEGEGVDSRWIGGAIGEIPDIMSNATIKTDIVTVLAAEGDQAAGKLTVESGGLIVDPGVTLTVGAGMTVDALALLEVNGALAADSLTAPGLAVFGAGAELRLGGGGVIGSVETGGNLIIDSGGAVDIALFDDGQPDH